jgi:hypothetical protein
MLDENDAALISPPQDSDPPELPQMDFNKNPAKDFCYGDLNVRPSVVVVVVV